jgi:hypothetical protein
MRLISPFLKGKNLDDISTLSDSDVVHVYDVFDQAHVDSILKKGKPKYVVSDHITSGTFDGIQLIGLPLFIERENCVILKNSKFDKNIHTNVCFNFMINKKQINRFLCIKLIEWFKLTDFDYTWSAVDREFDLSHVITELNSLGKQSPLSLAARSFILQPILLEKKFIEYSAKNNTLQDRVSITDWGGNNWVWNHAVQQMFLTSAVSIITESVSTQHASVFTEKTLFSVLGLTFPIWVGGHSQAREWSRLGFDIFDDIIDHSYQDYNTLIERCYYAIANNVDLLSDKTRLTQLRLDNKDRLLKNRDLLLTNHLETFVNQEVAQYPTDLQEIMPEILKYFRRQKL